MFTKSHAKYIQSLHHKKFRDEYGVFFAEGPKLVPELVEGRHFPCRLLAATPAWLLANAAWLKQQSIDEVAEVKDFELEKISALSQPNQVLAVFAQQQADAGFNPAGKITIVLDGLQDPGNMGTIIRIADWFGVPNIVCTPNCADRYNPKVVQATMGSLGRVNMLYADAAGWLSAHRQLPVYAAALDGMPLQNCAKIKEGIIIIGNESKGIGAGLMQMATQKITIAKKGQAESLNAAVALGIVLAQLTE
jgi:RNA methyltransferase, TrmH family